MPQVSALLAEHANAEGDDDNEMEAPAEATPPGSMTGALLMAACHRDIADSARFWRLAHGGLAIRWAFLFLPLAPLIKSRMLGK